MTQELKVSVRAPVAWGQIPCERTANQLTSEWWYLLAPAAGGITKSWSNIFNLLVTSKQCDLPRSCEGWYNEF